MARQANWDPTQTGRGSLKQSSTDHRNGGTGPTTCSPTSSTTSPAACSPSTSPSTSASAPCAGRGGTSPPTRAATAPWSPASAPATGSRSPSRPEPPGPGPAAAASLAVDLPPLSAHCHISAADGHLVLFHRPTRAIRLLGPLSNAVTDLPPISAIVAAAPPSRPEYLSAVFRNPAGVDPHAVNGAGFDHSTSPPRSCSA
ncbi:hypothetical protein BAE44_0019529 [Dichanthelium oligosanthes]|uniref:Uncharacterized protein n=1 Tax=Dichanthelium oligosanthes TaxID=888268 RepID=A0A1E5V2R9_9POAL|nr:hypothetical protein BAE44_0019529 [Dichanthelium oligosanthes]